MHMNGNKKHPNRIAALTVSGEAVVARWLNLGHGVHHLTLEYPDRTVEKTFRRQDSLIGYVNRLDDNARTYWAPPLRATSASSKRKVDTAKDSKQVDIEEFLGLS